MVGGAGVLNGISLPSGDYRAFVARGDSVAR